MTIKLKNELLDNSIKEFNKKNDSELFSLIENALESHTPETIHELYWNLKNLDKTKSDLETFNNLKQKLFQEFLDIWNDPVGVVEHYFNNPNLIEFTTNSIIQIIIDKKSLWKELEPIFNEYSDLDHTTRPKLEFFLGNMVTVIRKPNSAQKELIEHILALYSNIWFQVYVDGEGKAKKALIVEEKHSTAPLLYHLSNELMLRLYLCGDKSILPSSYNSYWHEKHSSKKSNRFTFDMFTVMLWMWAKEQKPSKHVPQKLKLLCAQLMNIASKYNNATKYTVDDFQTDTPQHIKDSWNNFQVAANDSTKRIKEKNRIELLKSIIP